MPQLFSRMDNINWLTPTIADMLDQGAAPPGGDGSIREQMLTLQKKLGDLEAPARVVNVRPTPSYTLFIAKPDTVGRLGNRRTVTHNEIKRSLGKIAEEKREWKLGFLPKMQENPDTIGILLRTSAHKPLSLRRLLVRSAYRDHSSVLSFAVGNTLDQKLVIRDLAQMGNLLVVGAENSKQHLLNSMLLTLLMLNTPGELRMAIVGESSQEFKALISTPHALGRLLTSPQDGQRLLAGLVKENQRRRQWLEDEKIDDITAYNVKLQEQGKTILPRIIVLLDSLSDTIWQETQDLWLPTVSALLEDQGKTGIHLILTSDQDQAPDLPRKIKDQINLRIVSRQAAGQYLEKLDNFHGSLMRFIDAALIEGEGNEEVIVPVELCAISQDEIRKTITYWHQASKQRQQEAEKLKISGTTGVTGLLQRPTELQTRELLSSIKSPDPKNMEYEESKERVAAPPEGDLLRQAEALAAYMGWISVGPLQDILWMTHEQAQETMAILKSTGIIEDSAIGAPRFIRLSGSRQPE